MAYKQNISFDKLITIDIETICNIFTVACKDYKTGAQKEFIIFDDKKYDGQALELFKFLRSCVRNNYTFITFNGLSFDIPVLHMFYEWCCDRQDPLYELSTATIIDSVYAKAQEIINSQDSKEYYKEKLYESQLFIPTIDVFKQKHYERKKCSLKWAEFSMRSENLMDMPIKHYEKVSIDDIPELMEYNMNDVIETDKFFRLNLFETELRMKLSDEYELNLINASEPKMARDIFAKFLAPQMNITYAALKKLNTIRGLINVKDIILPYTKFYTPELKGVLKDLSEMVIDCNPHNKKRFEYKFNYHGLPVILGLGGIHACIAPGVYEPEEDEYCEDSDVVSFYPNLAIRNGFKPKHLGEAFSIVYADIYNKRIEIPKIDPKNYVYKIILNSAYGLSSEINSYFYDKKYTYRVTINGQLSLLMLCEALYASVPGVKILQKNTDGITYIYKKIYKDKVDAICTWWENTTALKLEHAFYSKMVIQDVNNYIAVDVKGKIKKKGMFETEMEIHKNPSNLIIPKAVGEYFLNGTPIADTINNCADIFDFCAGFKAKSDFKLNLYRSMGTSEIVEEQQKVTRYFVSNNSKESGLLVKDYLDGRKISVAANTLIQPLNKVIDKNANNYMINRDFYTRKANEIVENIVPKVTQIEIFK